MVTTSEDDEEEEVVVTSGSKLPELRIGQPITELPHTSRRELSGSRYVGGDTFTSLTCIYIPVMD